MVWRLERGALLLPDETVRFQVWAPQVQHLFVQGAQSHWRVPMERSEEGVHTTIVHGLSPGDRYFYCLDGTRTRPDPVSRWQPEGVHGPSAIVDPSAFVWSDDDWQGRALQALVLYELHCGTFTSESTFAALLPYLDYLKDEVGVTAVELMPVAEFPGARNWGYDGVHPYAPYTAYGGPLGLKTLVNTCHEKGLTVVLDVVYNHLGPEGNYLSEYGPYFTDRYQTPWGQAVNFDGDDSREVRRYFIDNALYWITEYHIDALRLDAIHGIFDASRPHLLQELSEAVHTQANALGRTILVIAESDLNNTQVIADIKDGGWGLDAQWSDDFHHALHVLLTREQNGYYQDFSVLADLRTAMTDGFVYQGQISRYRRRSHGTPSRQLPGERFVICSQNHDQVGNRAYGDRLSTLVPFSALKLAAGLVLCAPNIPLLFMGEEYGETAPFLYFTSHTDSTLAQAVRDGRRREFARFAWSGEVPDPQDPQTFTLSLLHHDLRLRDPHRVLLRWYHNLIMLRKSSPALRHCNKDYLETIVSSEQQVLLVRRWQPQEEDLLLIVCFSRDPVSLVLSVPSGQWRQVLDADALQYGGTGQAALPSVLYGDAPAAVVLGEFACALYRRNLEDENPKGQNPEGM
jgi:maltooligosyltrehalose trehalohydrolase